MSRDPDPTVSIRRARPPSPRRLLATAAGGTPGAEPLCENRAPEVLAPGRRACQWGIPSGRRCLCSSVWLLGGSVSPTGPTSRSKRKEWPCRAGRSITCQRDSPGHPAVGPRRAMDSPQRWSATISRWGRRGECPSPLWRLSVVVGSKHKISTSAWNIDVKQEVRASHDRWAADISGFPSEPANPGARGVMFVVGS